jgi:hypothetical protein
MRFISASTALEVGLQQVLVTRQQLLLATGTPNFLLEKMLLGFMGTGSKIYDVTKI